MKKSKRASARLEAPPITTVAPEAKPIRELGFFLTERDDGWHVMYLLQDHQGIAKYVPRVGPGPHPKSRAVSAIEEFRRIASQFLIGRRDVAGVKEVER